MLSSSRFLSLALFAIVATSPLHAERFAIAPNTTVENVDTDSTFQALPHLNVKDEILCFWDGDILQGFITCVREDFPGDLKSYVAFSRENTEAVGALNLSFEEGRVLKTPGNLTIHRFDVSFTARGKSMKQLYYICPVRGGFQNYIVYFTNLDFFEKIRDRADKVLATAIVSDSVVK